MIFLYLAATFVLGVIVGMAIVAAVVVSGDGVRLPW